MKRNRGDKGGKQFMRLGEITIDKDQKGRSPICQGPRRQAPEATLGNEV